MHSKTKHEFYCLLMFSMFQFIADNADLFITEEPPAKKSSKHSKHDKHTPAPKQQVSPYGTHAHQHTCTQAHTHTRTHAHTRITQNANHARGNLPSFLSEALALFAT